MSADPHIAAFLALLEAHPYLGTGANSVPVVMEVPDPRPLEYVVVYPQVSYRALDELPVRSRRAVVRFVTHSVGQTGMAAQIIAGNVREAVLDMRPAIARRTCYPIRDEQSLPPERDESTGVLVMDAMTVWRLESVPNPV